MTETFSPPIPPSFDSSASKQARVLVANFGDGYRQRTGDGINNIGSAAPLVWDVLTQEQAEEIDTFLTEQAGWQAFSYRLPWKSSSELWSCKNWTVTPIGGGDVDFQNDHTNVLMSISATLEKEFDFVIVLGSLSLGAGGVGELALAPESEVTLQLGT